ncbi:uncharacterized protein EAE98_001982 [Botrytis deweyae]|uniref:Heterokaryon incompatibility domain-containing protein n=1 Tax=Botrytis deweyae TaxID=2478750 RepID=A0ABQ7IZD4_9HELO|nr:uncharacterized protein EAE98_001982 [Botrytis deweyae]KAF7937668.1 hypothetical protein EAE98_001982 [Botrytis deweyae]
MSDMSEEEIHEAVLAAGKKAKITGLCKRCRKIVGWFFLEPKVVGSIAGRQGGFPKLIYIFKIDELEPLCKLCNFFHSIWAEVKEEEDKELFSLARSTAAHLFGFGYANGNAFEPVYFNKFIFYLVAGEYANDPDSDRANTIFGFSNANAYKDGVAIRNLSLQADLSLVREWIRQCDDNHADSNLNCLPRDGISLQGFTVIDCKDGRNILVPGTTCMEYVTLSYVWGSEVSEGPDQFGKLPSTLPNLITDVIKVVIALGYRYLWIDRYCVPQDHSSDIKSLLIKNMDKIYSQSTLTIIATTAKCPSEGLPGISKPRIAVQKSLQMNSIHLVQWVSNIQYEINNSVWNTRGWTYQEALLSRRRLVFTETQCYFQCDAGGILSGRGGGRMESIDYDLTTERDEYKRFRIPMIFRPRPKHGIGWEITLFSNMVSEYTKRQLSKDSDVLPAFLGILGMFTSECSIFHGHIYGVPIFEPSNKLLPVDTTGTLIMGITWDFYFDTSILKDLTTMTLLSRRRSFPSWTWCDWTYASPSPHPIKWRYEILGQGFKDVDIVHDQKLSLEFDNGTILPWPREADLVDLAQKIMLMGNVRYIHIFGPFTHFPIPISSNPELGQKVCGPYVTDGSVICWLSRLARERGMNVTDNEEYVFKAWVYALEENRDYYPVDSTKRVRHVYMMLLDETSDSDTFERIDVCILGVELEREEKETGEKSMDMTTRLGWEWKAFRLA